MLPLGEKELTWEKDLTFLGESYSPEDNNKYMYKIE